MTRTSFRRIAISVSGAMNGAAGDRIVRNEKGKPEGAEEEWDDIRVRVLGIGGWFR